jgi:hypothetical protein
VYYNKLKITRQRGTLRAMNNYYPFGLMWDNPETMPNVTCQGKELQTDTWTDGSELALYDFGARMYDPVLGRWHCAAQQFLTAAQRRFRNASPEKFGNPMYQFDSPYNAMANNPVVNIDPDGMWSIPWGNIMNSVGTFLNSIRTTVTTQIGGTAKFGPGPQFKTTSAASFSSVGTVFQFGAAVYQAWQDGKMIKDAAGEMGSGIVDNYLADVKYYQANKPGFGDDGGGYDMSRYYTDKTLMERNVEHEFRFETEKGTTEWNVKSDEAVSMLNNGINTVIPGAIGWAWAGLPGIGFGEGMINLLSPSWFETVFDVDPRPGDVLKVCYKIEVHVSVLGNNSIQVFQSVEHTDKDGKVLKKTTIFQGKQELGITSADVELMKIIEQLSNIKTLVKL